MLSSNEVTDREFLAKSWEKGLERLAHIERLVGLSYVILFGLSYHIFDKLSTSGIYTLHENWLYVLLITMVGFLSIHLGNLAISVGAAIIDIEAQDSKALPF